MRIPHYRVWMKKTSEMGTVIDVSLTSKTFIVNLKDRTELHHFNDDSVVVMEGTNVFDVFGKEIYEGDLVKYTVTDVRFIPNSVDITFGVVVLGEKGEFLLEHYDGTFAHKDQFEASTIPYYDEWVYEIKILGNVYEEPSLRERALNKEQKRLNKEAEEEMEKERIAKEVEAKIKAEEEMLTAPTPAPGSILIHEEGVETFDLDAIDNLTLDVVKSPVFSKIYANLSKVVAKLTETKKAVDNKVKGFLNEEYLKSGETTLETESVKYTFVAGHFREDFNKKKFKEDHPDMYEEYITEAPVSASVRTKIIEKEEE